jgi:hypothetical protein
MRGVLSFNPLLIDVLNTLTAFPPDAFAFGAPYLVLEESNKVPSTNNWLLD